MERQSQHPSPRGLQINLSIVPDITVSDCLRDLLLFLIIIIIMRKSNNQHVTSVGQRKNLSPRKDSNLWPPKQWAGALSTWAMENSWRATPYTRFIFIDFMPKYQSKKNFFSPAHYINSSNPTYKSYSKDYIDAYILILKILKTWVIIP